MSRRYIWDSDYPVTLGNKISTLVILYADNYKSFKELLYEYTPSGPRKVMP